MFDAKQKQLISKKESTTAGKKTTTGNAFLQAGLKGAAKTRSGNGAVKFSTTGQPFVDQFGQCSNYKAPRKFDDVATSMSTLWGLSKLACIKFALYIRLITRISVFPDGSKTEKVQRGQGLKHEGIYRMMWLAVNYPDTFWKNVHLFITAGSWKDIITMLSYDLQFHGWENRKLDWNKFGNLLLAGLENDKTTNLVKKYLPQIKTNSRCKTLEAQADNIIAKWICSLLFGSKESAANYKKYRQLKTSGTAHEWQKLISQGKYLKINFNTVHGRALSQLVSGKFLKNQGLEKKYEEWLEKKPVAKYTGYPYELTSGISKAAKKYQEDTINKQFMGLVETAQKGAKKGTSLIVVRDTSGSMGSPATGTSISCYDVAKSLALFFSYLLPKGAFANSWIEFNSGAKMHQWSGSTPVERWKNDHSSYVGSTDFQKVIHLFCHIKKQGVKEEEFPTGILCISDGEFNPAMLGKTNVDAARATLKANGFSAEYVKNFQIILWNLGNSYYGRGKSGNKFETYGEAENVFYFSGLDGSVVTFLTGMEGSDKPAPKTDAELFDAAMDQELLNEAEV